MRASAASLLLGLTACQALYFEVLEGPEYRIFADTDFPLTVAFRNNFEAGNDTQIDLVSPDIPLGEGLMVFPKCEEDWHLDFENSSIYFSEKDIRNETEKIFMFSAYYWGYRSLSFYARPPNGDEFSLYNVVPMINTRTLNQPETSVEAIRSVIEKTEVSSNDIAEDVAAFIDGDTDEADDYVEPESFSGDGDSVPEDYEYRGFFGRKRRDVGDEIFLLTNRTVIVIDRKQTAKYLDTIFIATATTFMLTNTINMGCQLNAEIIMNVLRRPIGPAVGIASQFICMPIFSFLIGWLFLDDSLQRLGLFVLGCCPGGNASNFWTLLFNGDLNLSITMTFISTIVAMAMMPFWMLTLGSLLIDENSSFEIPYINLIGSLVSLTVPIGIGLLIKYKKPRWALISAKIVKPMTFCMVTFFLTVGMYNNHKAMLMMTWSIAAAGLLVSLGGYTAGALLSMLFCLEKKQIIAISIETAFQNAAIAFLLIKLSLPTPDSDLASVPPMAQIFQTGPPLLFVYLGWQLIQKCGYCIPEVDAIEENKRALEKESHQAETPLAEVTTGARAEEKEQLDPLNPFHAPPAYPELPPYSEKP